MFTERRYLWCFIGLVALSISCLLDDSDNNLQCSMASQLEGMRQIFRSQNKTAFVLGYTGEVGKELVKALISSRIFAKVTLIGRRVVSYEDEMFKDLDQKVVDFDKLDEYANTFEGIDVGYCCLGTTRGKAGADGFYKVDHDYVVNSAKLAKQGGCSQFHLVSSQGADNSSSLLYPKTKGQVEEELKEMNFTNLFIYRPAMLLCNRDESRPMEKVAKVLLKPIAWAAPTFITVPTSTVARSMINRTVMPTENTSELLDNKEIHRIGVCDTAN